MKAGGVGAQRRMCKQRHLVSFVFVVTKLSVTTSLTAAAAAAAAAAASQRGSEGEWESLHFILDSRQTRTTSLLTTCTSTGGDEKKKRKDKGGRAAVCQDVVNQMKLGRRRRFALLCAALHCYNVISDSGFRSRLAFSNGTAAVTGRKTDRQAGRQTGRQAEESSWRLVVAVGSWQFP